MTISQLATFPGRKNGISPMKEILNEHLSFAFLKEFLDFFRKNYLVSLS